MSTFGRLELIWRTKEISSGWPMVDPSPSQIGTLANRTISDTKMAKRKIAWNCGIVTEKDSNGTIHRAASKRILCAKCNVRVVTKLLV